MTKDEALKMAIDDAITKFINEILDDNDSDSTWQSYAVQSAEMIRIRVKNACKEALEQQEIGDSEIKEMLDDIEWYQQEQRKLIDRIKALEQPAKRNLYEEIKEGIEDLSKQKSAQEPMSLEKLIAMGRSLGKTAFFVNDNDIHAVGFMNKNTGELKKVLFNDDAKSDEWIDVFTHPHQWQGLTDDEIDAIKETIDYGCYPVSFARAIEAKLKEKNYAN